MEFGKDVLIDESALDVEWVNQASLALKYGKNFATCQDELDRAEQNVKLVRSELTIELEENSKKMPTGPLIEAYYRTHKRHIAAKERWLTAKKNTADAEHANKQIGVTRKIALQNLVTLHGQSYFAGPSVPRDLTFEATNARKQKEANKKVKLKRKK